MPNSWTDTMVGLRERDNDNGWHIIELSYEADPEKRPVGLNAKLLIQKIKEQSNDGSIAMLRKMILEDPQSAKSDKWIAEMSRNMSSRQWLQEMERKWNVFKGCPVFPTFREAVHVGQLKADIDYLFPILVGLDFGFRTPAMNISQWNGRTWKWLEEWTPINIQTNVFATGVWKRVEKYTKKGFTVRYFSGLEARQIVRQTGKTDADVFNEYGMSVQIIENTSIPDRLHRIRMLLRVWEDGVPALMIDESMKETIAGFGGGYRYPEKKEQKQADERPLKDGWYDNIFDSAEYVVEQMFSLDGSYHYTEEQESLIESKLAFPNPYKHRDLIYPYMNRGGRVVRNKRMGY